MSAISVSARPRRTAAIFASSPRDDKTPLKHHVEKYDSLLGEALVWVSVADLQPGAKNEIWLYYGNQKAPTAVDAKGTYDPDTLLVYHFTERGTPAQDVSAWANSAQSVGRRRRRRHHRAGRAPRRPDRADAARLAVAGRRRRRRSDLVGLDQDGRAAAAGGAVLAGREGPTV